MNTLSKLKILILISLAIALTIGTSSEVPETKAFTQQVIQKGAVGDDVIELQSRLQYIGFYNGKIDGVLDGELTGLYVIFRMNLE